jgi:hypothetical protein
MVEVKKGATKVGTARIGSRMFNGRGILGLLGTILRCGS